MDIPVIEIGKLLIALILGAIVGYEREINHKPAGLRTHILVALGATLVTIISVDFFPNYPHIIAAVITGIGFIGAGTLIGNQGNVHGLTTAASIWAVAIIGITVGVGYFALAFMSSLVVLLVLLFGKIEKKLEK